ITRVIDIIAPVISSMAPCVASLADLELPSSILAWTASTTTMASSTTIPIANTKANKVNKLIEYPKTFKKKNVPIIATGTAMAGIKVDLKSCKNINTTINTSINASIKVLTTLSIEAVKNTLVSYGIKTSIPSGKEEDISSSLSLMFSIIS